jgi:hypothetical protein
MTGRCKNVPASGTRAISLTMPIGHYVLRRRTHSASACILARNICTGHTEKRSSFADQYLLYRVYHCPLLDWEYVANDHASPANIVKTIDTDSPKPTSKSGTEHMRHLHILYNAYAGVRGSYEPLLKLD